MAIKLEAQNQMEQRVLDYLSENASDVLIYKINYGKKTLSGALKYCQSEARKLAKNAGAICIEDQTVFGWVIHYFEEDQITENKPKTEVVKKRTKTAVKKPEGIEQLDWIGTLMGGEV